MGPRKIQGILHIHTCCLRGTPGVAAGQNRKLFLGSAKPSPSISLLLELNFTLPAEVQPASFC